ncbi:GtrA family protein [Demequina lignilytica]|uniref:GtrA family protein n=1 Tax=Demequina lignilytica TaxID=3051663 RepID=A0AAW7M0F8_9MICO|nr:MULTISPECIES: GtrA family protein [unclassified Demequina]MDN4481935.1 GtrA family protein [Demequina sp. SYSU T0a273]MDN4486594.1 GtrA family protein [Demequina sp. SYSU T00039]MDN4489280.1 GtrA family protein [Demequina sp. SYSU T00068]
MDAVALTPARSGQLRALLARYRRFLLYALIGGGAVVVDVGLYAVLAVPVGLHPIAANTTSTFTAMVLSFAANSVLNFKVTDRIVARFLSFALVTGAGYVVSTLILLVLIDGLGANALVAKGATLPVVLLLQYTLNKKITFATANERTAS